MWTKIKLSKIYIKVFERTYVYSQNQSAEGMWLFVLHFVGFLSILHYCILFDDFYTFVLSWFKQNL